MLEKERYTSDGAWSFVSDIEVQHFLFWVCQSYRFSDTGSLVCHAPPVPRRSFLCDPNNNNDVQISRSSSSLIITLSPFVGAWNENPLVRTSERLECCDKVCSPMKKYSSIRIIIVNSHTLHFTGTTGTCRGGWGTTHPLPGVRDGRYFHYHDSYDYNYNYS